jgi:hypothetical protein
MPKTMTTPYDVAERIPSFDTILKVIGALGLTLRAEPIASEEVVVTSHTAQSENSSVSNTDR